MKFFPLRMIPDGTRIDFLGKRWYGFGFSLIMTIGALFFIFTHSLNWGIDFTGGVLMELRTEQKADLHQMREVLSKENFGEVSLQYFGDEQSVMVRIQTKEDMDQTPLVAKIKELLAQVVPGKIDYRKIDYVGPTVGQELVQAGTWACVLALAAILLYVWFRFEWQYGVGVVLSLIHDAVMVIGFYALTRYEFGLSSIAAVLAIIGYSVNDSVVIYDRIRENFRKYKKMPLFEVLNLSMNETLARSIMTHLTTLLAAIALILVGGEVLRGFNMAFGFGVLVGTYSSIFISVPALIYLNLRNNQNPDAAAKGAPA